MFPHAVLDWCRDIVAKEIAEAPDEERAELWRDRLKVVERAQRPVDAVREARVARELRRVASVDERLRDRDG